jgi:hypothetical protein
MKMVVKPGFGGDLHRWFHLSVDANESFEPGVPERSERGDDHRL